MVLAAARRSSAEQPVVRRKQRLFLRRLEEKLIAMRCLMEVNLVALWGVRPEPVRSVTGEHMADEDVAGEATSETIRNHRERDVIAKHRTVGAFLDQIRKGEWPTCVFCDGKIPQARILSGPRMKRCVGCLELHERDHGTTGDLRKARPDPIRIRVSI